MLAEPHGGAEYRSLLSCAAMTSRHTLVHRIEDWAAKKPDAPALHGQREDGSWYTITWAEYWTSVREAAKGLIALGHREGECVAIVGANHPQWVQLEFAIEAAGGIPAPIYPTNTLPQVGHIVTNAGAKIAICDGVEQLDKYLALEKDHGVAPFTKIVTFFDVPREDERVMSFEALRELGRAEVDDALDRRLAGLSGDTVALLIYTSGTTGVAKGVMLDHGGQILCGEGVVEVLSVFREKPYRAVSYLPLCHQAEQLVTNVGALETGGEIFFCPDMTKVKDALLHAHPTLFLAVPRVWEKFEAALRAKLGQATGIKAKMASWARETELACFDARSGTPLRRKLAHSLVLNKVKTALGLDQLEVAVTGAAPIAPETQRFFASLGIVLLDGYGMTETSGLATFTRPEDPVFGAVGKALSCNEVRIGDEGEIQLRGRNMTRGYFRMEEETRELFTPDGWLRTGDMGSLDEHGNVRITGRLKELIVTAGGKNVAPVEMESYIKSIEGVSQAVVIGDRKPYLVALITLDPEALPKLRERYPDDAALRAYLKDQVDERCNAKVAKYQTIKKLEILPNDLTVEGGELTASLKLRRKVIHEKYAAQIEAMYAAEARAAASAPPA